MSLVKAPGFNHLSQQGHSSRAVAIQQEGPTLGSKDLHSELWETCILFRSSQLLRPGVHLSVPMPHPAP